MKVAVRALTIASMIIWVFFMAFSATLIYSAIAVGVEVRDFMVNLNADKLTLHLRFHMLINNSGLYDLNDIEIKLALYDWYELLLAENVTVAKIIPHGLEVLLTPSLTANLSDSFKSIVNSSNPLLLKYEMKLNYAGVLPIKISGSTEIVLQGGEG